METKFTGYNNFNQAFVYPDQCLPTKEVQDKLNKFKQETKEAVDKFNSSEETKISKKILLDNIRDSLENNILHDKVKITKTLNKSEIGKIVTKYGEILDDHDFMWYVDMLMQAGFWLSSIFPVSFQPEALIIPDEFLSAKNKAVKKYNESKKETSDAIEFQNEVTKIANDVKKYFEDNNITVVDMMNSGAKGNASHIQSLLLSVGLSINSFGKINDVIENSHTEGMTQTQFFNNSSQAIQALYAKSSETSKPGYLGRKLSTIGSNVKLSSKKDCGSDKFLKLKIEDSNMLKSLIGRQYKATFMGLNTITETSDLVGETIELRSPLYCIAEDGICETCYNRDYIQKMGLKPGANIGLLAGTGITGTLVNLTLKKSHVGVSLDQTELDLKEELKKMY